MTDKEIAKQAGFYISRGAYVGTTDDNINGWYIGHVDEPFRPLGRGCDRPSKAWAIAANLAREQHAA